MPGGPGGGGPAAGAHATPTRIDDEPVEAVEAVTVTEPVEVVWAALQSEPPPEPAIDV